MMRGLYGILVLIASPGSWHVHKANSAARSCASMRATGSSSSRRRNRFIASPRTDVTRHPWRAGADDAPRIIALKSHRT
jgi:hypothetical protein